MGYITQRFKAPQMSAFSTMDENMEIRMDKKGMPEAEGAGLRFAELLQDVVAPKLKAQDLAARRAFTLKAQYIPAEGLSAKALNNLTEMIGE